MPVYELITIGGGAAGFFGAIHAAEQGSLPCLILEKAREPLGKVKISGGGRCNVTHHCFDPRELIANYPRGGRSLIGPFHRFNATDTVSWFEQRGVELKTEPDGRMFPTTDSSQTVIDCLRGAAREAGAQLRCQCAAANIERLANRSDGARFAVHTHSGEVLPTRHLLLASGGTRLAAGAKLATSLGHSLVPNVPSLFTFKIEHPLIEGLPGLSVAATHTSVEGTKLRAEGPTLITHWGLSGPGILKLSAWGARELAALDYQFKVQIDWLPGEDASTTLRQYRKDHGKRSIARHSPFPAIPRRLWTRFTECAEIPPEITWSQLSRPATDALLKLLKHCRLPVTGKSLNKDEFVTAGGVELKEVNLKRFESKLVPGLFLAGEILDIDGITGGFNFQNAWTGGYIAGTSIAGALD